MHRTPSSLSRTWIEARYATERIVHLFCPCPSLASRPMHAADSHMRMQPRMRREQVQGSTNSRVHTYVTYASHLRAEMEVAECMALLSYNQWCSARAPAALLVAARLGWCLLAVELRVRLRWSGRFGVGGGQRSERGSGGGFRGNGRSWLGRFSSCCFGLVGGGSVLGVHRSGSSRLKGIRRLLLATARLGCSARLSMQCLELLHVLLCQCILDARRLRQHARSRTGTGGGTGDTVGSALTLLG